MKTLLNLWYGIRKGVATKRAQDCAWISLQFPTGHTERLYWEHDRQYWVMRAAMWRNKQKAL